MSSSSVLNRVIRKKSSLPEDISYPDLLSKKMGRAWDEYRSLSTQENFSVLRRRFLKRLRWPAWAQHLAFRQTTLGEMDLDQHDKGSLGDRGVNVHLCGGFPFLLVSFCVLKSSSVSSSCISWPNRICCTYILPIVLSQCALTAWDGLKLFPWG